MILTREQTNLKTYNPYIVIFTLLLETTFIGITNIFLNVSQDIASLRIFAPFANIMLFVLSIFVILSVNQTIKNTRLDLESRLLKIHLRQMEDMVKALHVHNQEHIQHLQTLQSLLYIEEYSRARNYVDQITREYTPVFDIINVGDPALAAMLYSKQKVAETRGVEYDFAIKCALDNIGVPSADLCSMIGHLLDNALEACMCAEGPRRAGLEIKYEDEGYLIYVFNNGPEIPETEKSRIFEPGYTTADSAGRGFGLHQVQRLAESHGGKIEVITRPRTTFIIKLPEGVTNHAEKPGPAGSGADGAFPAI